MARKVFTVDDVFAVVQERLGYAVELPEAVEKRVRRYVTSQDLELNDEEDVLLAAEGYLQSSAEGSRWGESRSYSGPNKRGSLDRLQLYIAHRKAMEAEQVPSRYTNDPRKYPNDSAEVCEIRLQFKLRPSLIHSTFFDPPEPDKPDEIALWLQNLLRQAKQEGKEIQLETSAMGVFKDSYLRQDLREELLSNNMAAVMALWDYLVILDPDLPPKDLAKIWADIQTHKEESEAVWALRGSIPRLPSQYSDEDRKREAEEREWVRNLRGSKKNARSISREREYLGRLAFEICLNGTYMGEAGFYKEVLKLYRGEAKEFGFNPNHYDVPPGRADRTVKVRSALNHLEKRLISDGSPSPFRRAST